MIPLQTPTHVMISYRAAKWILQPSTVTSLNPEQLEAGGVPGVAVGDMSRLEFKAIQRGWVT